MASISIPSPLAAPEPTNLPEIEPNFFELGLDKAVGALSISQSAQSPDDWQLVISQYQEAIALMKKVSQQSPRYAIARTKIGEYQQQIQYAQQKAFFNPPTAAVVERRVVVLVPKLVPPPLKPLPPPIIDPNIKPIKKTAPIPVEPEAKPQLLHQQEVYTVPIKRRIGGTPIIEVTFNGNRQFEMIVDTGASGTVITQSMANALEVVPIGKAKANTASSKAVEFPIGYVDSMAVAGVTVDKVAVAIAGSELETGLLGHDFFGDYELTIKRNVVEFRTIAEEWDREQ
jgi:predicted aspartyl protease